MFVRPKGKRERTVVIPPELIDPLRDHFASQDADRHAAGDAWEDWDLARCGRGASRSTRTTTGKRVADRQSLDRDRPGQPIRAAVTQ